MQTASSSGISDIAELANWPNYSHLPPPVNIVIAFLSHCYLGGYSVKWPDGNTMIMLVGRN